MALNRFMFFSIPVITAVTTFLTYSSLGNQMDAALIFSSMALFNLIQEYLQQLPNAVAILTQVLVAQKRIRRFLDAEELAEPAADIRTSTGLPPDGYGLVALHGITARWDATATPPSPSPSGSASASTSRSNMPTLRDLTLEARGGELVAIVGSVGAGKSSVLATILGEMVQLAGRVELRGTVGFCAQQPWLISGTLRDNIVFGGAFDQRAYDATIRACGLLPDLEQLPGGEETVIGERGINISGGQKARIALARAVYRQADLYLLDDVLAAVDVHVGEHLMSECICGMLKNRTRVLVTNALHFLPRCDRIYVLDERTGTIAESGTYEELMSLQDGLLLQMGAEHTPSSARASAAADDAIDSKDIKDSEALAATRVPSKDGCGGGGGVSKSADGKLIEAEERKYGKVPLSAYVRYLRSGASDVKIALLLSLGYLGPEFLTVGSQLWLAEWSSSSSSDTIPVPLGPPDANTSTTSSMQLESLQPPTIVTRSVFFYQAVYGCLALAALVLLLGRSWVWANVVVKTAQHLHANLLANVLRLPVSFFDRTPTGRILNRFSHDIDQIDVSSQMLLH